MTQTLFRNFRMLDPERDELVGGCEILVEGETIREVSERPIRASDAAVVDCGGRTLMPGLIDCHAHVILSEVFIRQLENLPLTLMTARAVVTLKAMLERRFTTVRDTGGRGLGIEGGRGPGADRGAAPVHLRAGDRTHRWARGRAPAHGLRASVRVLPCARVRDGDGGR